MCEYIYIQKVQYSSSCLVMRLDVSAVVSIWWNPEEVGSNADEGMNLQKQAGKERKVPCFMSFT